MCADQLGIKLLFLPPYSPNLNLIERFWKHVKTEVLNAAYYSTFDDFKATIHRCISNSSVQAIASLDTIISEGSTL
ncbi:MAG: transposase [Syntrophomonadaceae bacterium]|nr:transposase [Syntrophomonadaceae bacterium]